MLWMAGSISLSDSEMLTLKCEWPASEKTKFAGSYRKWTLLSNKVEWELISGVWVSQLVE